MLSSTRGYDCQGCQFVNPVVVKLCCHFQPMCDGAHKRLDTTHFVKKVPKFRPIRFTVEETKEYWLCNCKQSGKRPFCDGTHKRQDIQEAIRS